MGADRGTGWRSAAGSAAVAAVVLALLVGCSPSDGGHAGGVTTTPGLTFSGVGSAAFCARARSAEDQLNGAAASATTPDGLRMQITAQAGALHDLAEQAPAEIAPDTNAMAAAYDQLAAAMAQVGWDYSKLPQQTDAALDGPSVSIAASRLQAYERDVCGIKTA